MAIFQSYVDITRGLASPGPPASLSSALQQTSEATVAGRHRAAQSGPGGARGEAWCGQATGLMVKPWENHRKTMGKWWFDGILWDLPSGYD